jgi:hypothetical protein
MSDAIKTILTDETVRNGAEQSLFEGDVTYSSWYN